MLTASSTVTIEGATPQEVLELVLDLERYMTLDHKIVKVSSITGPDESGNGSVKLWGKLRLGPAAPDVQDFVLERWNRLTFTGATGQPGRLIFNFTGSFVCEPFDGGTKVTHSYEFVFRRAFRWLEGLNRDWLQAELDDEMQRLQTALEG